MSVETESAKNLVLLEIYLGRGLTLISTIDGIFLCERERTGDPLEPDFLAAPDALRVFDVGYPISYIRGRALENPNGEQLLAATRAFTPWKHCTTTLGKKALDLVLE